MADCGRISARTNAVSAVVGLARTSITKVTRRVQKLERHRPLDPRGVHEIAETNRRRPDSAKGKRLTDPRPRAVRWRAPTPMRLRGGNS